MARPRRSRPYRYQCRFFGRELQRLIREKADEEEWTQGEVADWLGFGHDQVSKWILGHAHPSEQEFPKLAPLVDGDDEEMERLLRFERLDKLDYYRRQYEFSPEELREMAREIEKWSREHGDSKPFA